MAIGGEGCWFLRPLRLHMQNTVGSSRLVLLCVLGVMVMSDRDIPAPQDGFAGSGSYHDTALKLPIMLLQQAPATSIHAKLRRYCCKMSRSSAQTCGASEESCGRSL